MKRKLVSLIFTLVILLGIPLPVKAESAAMPEVSAKSAVILDALTGRVIWEKNGEERLPMASTTKIMTALLTLEQPGLDEMFEVDADAIRVEGSSMGLTEGAIVSLRTLAAGMLLPSGNDAANAAAVRIAGSIPEFVIMMNRRAAQLGLSDTNFETPSGLDGQNHYTTAKDLARLARAALQNEDFRAICSQSSMKVSFGNPPADRWLTNHNRLLKEYEGCIGVKTGFTKKAGRCLVSAAERDGLTLICVTLNDPDDWADHTALLDAAFAALKPAAEPNFPGYISLVGGEKDAVSLKPGETEPLFLTEEEASRLETEIFLPKFLYAPVTAGQEVGEIRYILDGETIDTRALVASENVTVLEKEPDFWEQFSWFHKILLTVTMTILLGIIGYFLWQRKRKNKTM